MTEPVYNTVARVLKTHGPFNLTPLAGDASTRRYFRVRFQEKAPFPSAIIMWLAEPSPPEEELPFVNVQRTLSQMGVRVPAIHYNAAFEKWLLLEDLGDRLLQDEIKSTSTEKVLSYYQQAMKEIFKMQFAAGSDRHCLAYRLAFDAEKLCWELEFLKKHTLEGLIGIRFSKTEEKILSSFFVRLSEALSEEPRFFTHRDFHSRNLLVQNETIRVIDFQDARMGPCQYDLVSLIYDAYIELPGDIENQLLEEFKTEHKRRNGNRFSDSHFNTITDWMKLQRSLKAAGTFGYMATQRQNGRYLKYLPRVFQLAHEALEKYPEFSDAKQILEPALKEQILQARQIQKK